jgi:hypothetical protein
MLTSFALHPPHPSLFSLVYLLKSFFSLDLPPFLVELTTIYRWICRRWIYLLLSLDLPPFLVEFVACSRARSLFGLASLSSACWYRIVCREGRVAGLQLSTHVSNGYTF